MNYRTFRAIVRFAMKIITDIEVYGREKMPEGNFIAAANHLGRLDTAALFCVIDREDVIMPVAEKYKNHPLFGVMGRAVNAISNLSEGEKLSLCVDVALSKPNALQIILIDGAEKLSDENRTSLYKRCKEHGLQFIATRSTNDNELEVHYL
jgi:1-acyl-sn-glycerol-3-phosphate acyltransferase